MLSDLHDQLAKLVLLGEFRELVVVLSDPSDPTGRTRNVYEDIDQEGISRPRQAIVTLFPEYSKAAAKGFADTGQIVLTHARALRDMQKMIDQGYKILSIRKD